MFSRELNNANTVKRMADFLGHHGGGQVVIQRDQATIEGYTQLKFRGLRMREDGSTFYETMDLTKI